MHFFFFVCARWTLTTVSLPNPNMIFYHPRTNVGTNVGSAWTKSSHVNLVNIAVPATTSGWRAAMLGTAVGGTAAVLRDADLVMIVSSFLRLVLIKHRLMHRSI